MNKNVAKPFREKVDVGEQGQSIFSSSSVVM